MKRLRTDKKGSEKVAYVFPGQGSQTVGMGKDIYNSSEAARKVFKTADESLGFSLSKLCFDGPAEQLNLTCMAQPAILTTSLAYWEANKEKGYWKQFGSPVYTAGHSLGEYTALVAAKVVDFPEAIRLVWERGCAMHQAGNQVPGGMVAVLGMEENELREICRETNTDIANINCPGQIIISGSLGAIEKAVALAKQHGARKTIFLNVSGAFHCGLMEPAIIELNKAIESTPFRDPEFPIIGNVNAMPITRAAELKRELHEQLCHCVQWQKSIEYMIQNEVSTFIEVGPGRVLTGLIKRINTGVSTLGVPA
ncbi:MAG: ACP S-malonyltransferase [Dehalococcoidia bacterium]|nr:ACP S-malonyltransferase [Dehalococcoidia bacterium]